jgi:hypothetical protein
MLGLSQMFWYSMKCFLYKIKMSLKFGASRIICFCHKSFACGFIKISSFCPCANEQREGEEHFMLEKGHILSLNPTHRQF